MQPDATDKIGYQPKGSGMLQRAGRRRSRPRRSVIEHHALTHQIPDVHITDKKAVRTQIWDFDPLWEFEYSQRELMMVAEKILLEDPKPWWEEPYWLPASNYMERLRHEIYTGNGTPDPSVESGLYWRTHPQGRKFNKVRDAQKRQAFYR